MQDGKRTFFYIEWDVLTIQVNSIITTILQTEKNHESAQEWIGRLCTKASDSEYHEYSQGLAEQFIHDLDDKSHDRWDIEGINSTKDINEATSDQIFIWIHKVEAERVQRRCLTIWEKPRSSTVKGDQEL